MCPIIICVFTTLFAVNVFGVPAEYFDNVQPRVLEAQLNETLECLRDVLQNGIPEYGIPSYETIFLEELDVDISELGTGHLRLKNLTVTGHTGFVATELRGTISLIPVGFRVEGTIVIPTFTVSADYDLDAVVSGVIVYGTGKVSISTGQISFDVNTFLSILEILNLTELSIYIHIDSSYTEITGWFHDDEHSQVISDLVNDFFIPAWINQQPQDISDVISPILMQIANDALAGLSTRADDDESLISIIYRHCTAEEGQIYV